MMVKLTPIPRLSGPPVSFLNNFFSVFFVKKIDQLTSVMDALICSKCWIEFMATSVNK